MVLTHCTPMEEMPNTLCCLSCHSTHHFGSWSKFIQNNILPWCYVFAFVYNRGFSNVLFPRQYGNLKGDVLLQDSEFLILWWNHIHVFSGKGWQENDQLTLSETIFALGWKFSFKNTRSQFLLLFSILTQLKTRKEP